jgi:hypothetical protein
MSQKRAISRQQADTSDQASNPEGAVVLLHTHMQLCSRGRVVVQRSF